ncbi:signal peptidase I [Candidatus Bathyarchaeota archaeon]|jgi:signal peptidase I|nr:signal peptidase I [Candidatus Bathyarchaeota archaeon]MBT4320023.1 signal peptidase I [Candidatus Bathyarchaeota archaeon]MBT4423858.1 signal peptidase I [Candidatus Bathyarchaeota archaeon]MBT6604778.1 signal peptidase I [Candidatus Bathyarchaeota archaeon]MBT7186382.1 signal peptidase I [Candidatus Bathyarchaeota archaeon]
MNDGQKEIIRYAVTFIALIVVFYGGTVVMRNSLGTANPMMVVISQSMIPTLGVGDFIFIQSIDDFDTVNIGDPPVGDILVFFRPGYSEEYIVHRAIGGTLVEARWVYQTKGDHNAFQDGFTVDQGLVAGKVINRIPILGYFSLFIKTMKGFGLILTLMAVSFFYEDVLPKKTEENRGTFNSLSVAPFLIAPIIILKIWVTPENHADLEIAAIAAWYLGCIVLPLATEDDDMGLMFWLYHLVLLMIPIACDLVWWQAHITPSQWWRIQGSIVPVSWLLMEETNLFNQAFTMIITWLGPGILIFLGLLYAKRSNIVMVKNISDLLRRVE